MIYNHLKKERYESRWQAKMALGGTKGFNEALKRGELLFVDGNSVTSNSSIAVNQFKTLSYHEEPSSK